MFRKIVKAITGEERIAAGRSMIGALAGLLGLATALVMAISIMPSVFGWFSMNRTPTAQQPDIGLVDAPTGPFLEAFGTGMGDDADRLPIAPGGTAMFAMSHSDAAQVNYISIKKVKNISYAMPTDAAGYGVTAERLPDYTYGLFHYFLYTTATGRKFFPTVPESADDEDDVLGSAEYIAWFDSYYRYALAPAIRYRIVPLDASGKPAAGSLDDWSTAPTLVPQDDVFAETDTAADRAFWHTANDTVNTYNTLRLSGGNERLWSMDNPLEMYVLTDETAPVGAQMSAENGAGGIALVLYFEPETVLTMPDGTEFRSSNAFMNQTVILEYETVRK